MHDELFANHRALEPERLSVYAGKLGLNLERFQACLAGGKYAASVRQSLEQGSAVGVQGTPHFIVGLARPGSSEIRVATSFSGAQPYNVFEQIVEKLTEYLAQFEQK